jgi:hypothetical protein
MKGKPPIELVTNRVLEGLAPAEAMKKAYDFSAHRAFAAEGDLKAYTELGAALRRPEVLRVAG